MNGIELLEFIIDNELLKNKEALKEFGEVIFESANVNGLSLKTSKTSNKSEN
ncbi:hypothetical protein [Enterococcus xiangfangensis]|uniref:hypothetical protein n=1 Tax=Enterococcus xiangfangensis TaxID=1296537 RepID=UPI003D16F0C6